MTKGILKFLRDIFQSTAKTHKLEIELVPFTMHGANVRARIDPPQWKKVCSVVHKAARNNYRCQICNGSGKNQNFAWPVECHEIWVYDENTHTQRLKGLISLCPMCHLAKHYGLAKKQGFEQATRSHLMKVNRLSSSELDAYLEEAMQTVKERSKHSWQLDLTYLNKREFGFLMIDFTSDERSKCDDVVF